MVPKQKIQRSFSPPETPLIVFCLNKKEGCCVCSGVLQGISQVAREENWKIIDLEFWDSRVPEGMRPAGALVDVLPDSSLALHLREKGIPAVRIGRLPHPLDAEMPAVLPNLQEAGRMAAAPSPGRAANLPGGNDKPAPRAGQPDGAAVSFRSHRPG